MTAEAVLALVVWLAPAPESPQGWGLESVGLFSGSSYGAREHYDHAELVASLDSPWNWTSRSGWRVAAQLHLTGGAMWAAGNTATMLGGGPQIRVSHPQKALALAAASGPLWISQTRFGEEDDFGGPTQFLSHLSIGFAVGERRQFRLLGRVAHISNASVYGQNDGVNIFGLMFEYGLP